jgi:hypothetical protein
MSNVHSIYLVTEVKIKQRHHKPYWKLSHWNHTISRLLDIYAASRCRFVIQCPSSWTQVSSWHTADVDYFSHQLFYLDTVVWWFNGVLDISIAKCQLYSLAVSQWFEVSKRNSGGLNSLLTIFGTGISTEFNTSIRHELGRKPLHSQMLDEPPLFPENMVANTVSVANSQARFIWDSQ